MAIMASSADICYPFIISQILVLGIVVLAQKIGVSKVGD
jgi:hypothetical protein